MSLYYVVDETHNSKLCSFVKSANSVDTDFPIQNLPFGVAVLDGERHIVVAIGDSLLDLCQLSHSHPGVLDTDKACSVALMSDSLNLLMALSTESLLCLRQKLSNILSEASKHKDAVSSCLVEIKQKYALPHRIGDYTDFYACYNHAFAVGKMFRPDNPVLPNYVHIPIGYHGRASSIFVSPGEVVRPMGQLRPVESGGMPSFDSSKKLDFELELGICIGAGNVLGDSIDIAEAENHIFGYCLLNDWSARDMQNWEYQPLGPFLAKSFASTLSPFVITSFALAPYRCSVKRGDDLPPILEYLSDTGVLNHGGIDISMSVELQSSKMMDAGMDPQKISDSNSINLMWSPAQMVAHHTSNGCNLNAGDLFGSGTISGTEDGTAGSMLELTTGGKHPLKLQNGEERDFLYDGDLVRLNAECKKSGFARIGFGACEGIIKNKKSN